MNRCCDDVGHLASGYCLTKSKLILKLQGIDCGLPRPPYRADVEVPESALRPILDLIERCSPQQAGQQTVA